MPRAKGKKKAPEPEIYLERTQISSVIFGLVMVVAMIVAGAAMLGGSLSQMGQRWGSAMDGVSRAIGLSVDTVEVIGLEHVPAVARQIKASAMVEPGENMFRADPHLIQRRVEDTRLVANVRVFVRVSFVLGFGPEQRRWRIGSPGECPPPPSDGVKRRGNVFR